LLTVIAGSGAAYVGWDYAPAMWTPMRVLGLCLAVAGFVLWTAARFQLGNSFAATAQANQLIDHGLYSKIRNPIYLFGSLFIASYCLLLGRPMWLMIFALIIPLQIWRMRNEANVLEAKFGEEYRQYRRSTWL
jgi:protein-S-isoprenylcysteine O-methyltransferase Ste14